MNLFSLLKEIKKHLPPKRKKQLVLLLLSMCLAAVIEAGTLGLIAIYASTVNDAAAIFHSQRATAILRYFGAYAPTTTKEFFIILSIAVVLAIGIKNVLNTGLQYVIAKFSTLVSGFLGEKLVRGLLLMPYEWHLRQNSSDLVTTFAWRDQVANIILSCLQFSVDFILICFLFFGLLFVNPIVTAGLILFIGGPAFFIFSKTRPRIDKHAVMIKETSILLNRQATQIVHGIKDIKMISSDNLMSKLSVRLHSLANTLGLQALFLKMPHNMIEFIGFFMLCGTILFLNMFAEISSIEITGIAALLAVTAWRVLPAIVRIIANLSTIRANLPIATRVLKYVSLFEENPYVNLTGVNNKQPFRFNELISIQDVSFAYEGATIESLSGVNLDIKKGESIGIIGTSGAGKSTLADILIGFLKPVSGEICIDDKKIEESGNLNWMRQIGYVAQSPYICDDTLLSNIALEQGPEFADRDFVLECCKMANIDDFLDQLPGGIDTQIGERGVLLSGGQRQRVAIARALYRKPSFIVFDEATSALDTRSEKEIQKTMQNLHGKMTMVIIAHRLTTIKHCDRLVWLEKGKMKMVGKPESILPYYMDSLGDDDTPV
ncbi:ABC transporter ATP-binding protein [Thermodesulfobacteriota bacterium]